MVLLSLAIRLGLAAVLTVAGITKLFDRPGSEESLAGFGVPDRWIDVLAWLLPLAELALATTLLPARSVTIAAGGSCALFAIFTLVVAVHVRRGDPISCHCFGALHSGAINRWTVARNAILTALAAFLLVLAPWNRHFSPLRWMDNLAAGDRALLWAQLGLFGATVVLLGFTLQLHKRLDSLSEKFEELAKNPKENEEGTGRPKVFSPNRGLPIGAPAPDFSLQSLDDEELTLSQLISRGIPALIAFVAPNCPPCEALLPVLERWDHQLSGKLTIAIISSGTGQDDVYALAKTQLLHVADNGASIHKDYDAAWTPSAVLVHPQGTVGSRLANGATGVEELLRHFAGNQKNPWLGVAKKEERDDDSALAAPKFGEPAPLFSLRDRNERRIGLSDFLGRKVLLLFWNANCGFCRRMAPAIRAFEDNPPRNELQILIITTGSVRSARQFGFRSPVLPARNSKIDEKYGVLGTPSALLIDEEGRIASSLETEATGILKLLGIRKPLPAI